MIGQRLNKIIARFLLNQSGTLAISFAIAAPALMVVAGMATDYAFMVRYRTELQTVADAAAIAGAREMTLAQSNASQVDAVVASYVAVNAKKRGGPVTTTTQVNSQDAAVDVSLSQAWAPFFLHFVEGGVTQSSFTPPPRPLVRKRSVLSGSTRARATRSISRTRPT